MLRRISVLVLLAGLLAAAVVAYVQAQRIDADSDPGWESDTGELQAATGTPLLSARRAPGWLTAPISETRLAQRLAVVADSSGVPERTCVVVRRNGEPVVSRNGAEPLAPSSLMKIVTATAILEKAGPSWSYRTEVFARADALDAAPGVLVGDLYLVGRGDPVLSTPSYIRRFSESTATTDLSELVRRVAAALAQRGISTVEGSVVADESWFPEEERDYAGQRPGPGGAAVWEPSHVNENAAGPLSALLLNNGYISFPPSTDPARMRQSVRAVDPALHAATVFSAMLGSEGVTVTGLPVKGVAPPLALRASLGDVRSPQLTEIVTRMLRNDDNTIAEMLLKEIGRRSDGSARAQAVMGVYDVLQRMLRLPTEGMVVSDGSGLSLQSRLSCDLIAELLERAGPQSTLVQGMSEAGRRGALRDCLTGEEGSGNRVWALAGARDGTAALAGATVAEGDVLVLASISNSEDRAGSSALCGEQHEALISVVAGHPYWGSDAGDLLEPLPAVVPTAPSPGSGGVPGSGSSG